MSRIRSQNTVKNITEVREHVVRNFNNNLVQKSVQGLEFAIIEDSFNQYINYLKYFDGIFLLHTHLSSTHQFIKSLRSHSDLRLSLKPLFIYGAFANHIREEKWTIDGKVRDMDLLDDTVFKTQQINKIIQDLPDIEVDGYHFIIHKSIIFHHTRGQDCIQPYHSIYSKMGYAFTHVSFFVEHKDRINELSVIQYGVDKNWLLPDYVDSAYVCNNCESGFLTYREVCPSCASSDLREHDIIHHFRCAHVGPLSGFIQDDQVGSLVCPKCYKELQHVGVDYDRPSVIQQCNKCKKEFQSYAVMARCCNCHQDTPVEHLKKKSIHNYTITPKGLNEALTEIQNPGLNYQKKEQLQSPGWLRSKKVLHDYMMKMTPDLTQRSYLTIIRIKSIQPFLEQIGRGKIDELFIEISSILHTHFSKSEIAIQYGKIYMVVTNIKLKNLRSELLKADLLIRTSIQDNLKIDVEDLFGYKHLLIYEYVHEWHELLDLLDEEIQ